MSGESQVCKFCYGPKGASRLKHHCSAKCRDDDDALAGLEAMRDKKRERARFVWAKLSGIHG